MSAIARSSQRTWERMRCTFFVLKHLLFFNFRWHGLHLIRQLTELHGISGSQVSWTWQMPNFDRGRFCLPCAISTAWCWSERSSDRWATTCQCLSCCRHTSNMRTLGIVMNCNMGYKFWQLTMRINPNFSKKSNQCNKFGKSGMIGWLASVSIRWVSTVVTVVAGNTPFPLAICATRLLCSTTTSRRQKRRESNAMFKACSWYQIIILVHADSDQIKGAEKCSWMNLINVGMERSSFL